MVFRSSLPLALPGISNKVPHLLVCSLKLSTGFTYFKEDPGEILTHLGL